MSIFCLLWIPLFCLLARSFYPFPIGASDTLALILGSIAAVVQFFMGAFIDGGLFGLSRWIYSAVDIVGAPVVLPIVFYGLFLPARIAKRPLGFANFVLLWLIPSGIMRTVAWGISDDPSRLVLVPLLWTAVAAGFSFFIELMAWGRHIAVRLTVIFFAGVGAVAITPLAATVYWAFYSQKDTMGYWLLAVSLAPTLAWIIYNFVRKYKTQ